MVNDLMCEPYEVVGGMMFRYKISAQGGDASVKIALPFFVVSLLTDGKPESINFADTPNGGVFYCIPGSSFSFDLIVAESADGNIPSVASTGSQTPRLVGKVADRRFRYVIDELSGPAAISISGVISGQVIIPLPAQLPQGLSFFAGKEGEAFLSGGTYTFPVMQSVNDSFALLLNKKYRRIEPSVSISSGSLDTLITSDSTRVYHINTSFSQEKDYKVYLSIAFPPLSSILLPSTPQGAAYINGFEPGIWYCTAHSDSLFSFDIQLNEFYKHARLSLLRGETSFLPVPVDGALRYTLSGEENINDLSFKMEFHSLTIPSNIPTGLSYRTGNAVGGQPFLTPGNYIFSPQQTKSLFAIEVDLEQVVVDATPLVTITTGNSTVPIVPDSSAVSGDNRKTYFFSCLTQGHASSLINVSIPFYRITLNPIPPQFANMLAFANGSEPEIGELLAGERYEFYLRLKAPYTEADIIVDIDGDTLVPKPQGNHIYHFSFIANNNVTPTIGLRYASVSLSPPPPNVFYIGSRSNLSPLYHQYDDWKDSFSIKLLPEYAFVLPLVKTSNNTILQHASFNGDTYTYTYVFSGSGDMNVSVSLPYKTVSFPPLPQGIAYIPPISHGNFFFSANREFSFSLQTTEAFSNAVPLVKAEQLTLADEDTDPHDRIYRYSVTLAETDLALSISLKYRQLSYLPIDPPVRAFIKYDPALRDSGVYRFSPNIATHIDTFALIRDEANIANLPFSFSVAASNGVTVQEVDGKPLTYAVLSTDDTEISVSVNKLTVSLPQLPSGLVYDQPPSYSLSDYPKQPGSYSLYPSQRFSFTLRPTDNYASLIPAVSVNGNSLPPAVYSGNKYEYSFSVTANASPLITMPFVSCSLPSLPEGFTYASGGSNKTAGLWPHATGIPFRDTFEIVIAPGFANVQYVIIASTPSVPETKLSPIPGSNRYVVSGNGTENITVTLSAPYHTIILPGLSSTPQLHYAEGSPADNAIHRHPPGVMFSFTIQRDAGVRATPTATLAGVNVTCTEIATDVFRFSFTLPQEADQTLTYSPLITLPPVFTLTLPSLLPQGVHYASDSLAAGVHLFPQDADLSFVLQTDPGLDGINPVVTKDNGSRVERIDLGENKNRYNCGKNQNVEIKSIEMNFFTVIINPPPEGVLVAPPAAIYNRHTDLSFTFTMTTPVLPPLTSLVVESNGVVLAPEILETGGLYFTISASAPHDTFHVSSKLQSTVSNQPSLVHGKTPVVAYKDACLLISGLNGCHLSLISLTGVTIARFSTTEQVTPSLVPEADYWLYPLTLPSGVYILYAEKERNRPLTLKFVVP
jgi:hypothetical protein